jgi:16S rRNA (adenine1518-N6/adenine1519-N6)-dimethyltransferase
VAQTKHQIQDLLASISAEPRKRFGQNFMIDQNLLRLVAEAGRIGPHDVVIEVGPGTGSLTEELLSRAGRVIAVEIDRDLAKLLRERFAPDEKLELIEADALHGKHELNPELQRRIAATRRTARAPSHQSCPPLKLVANLPYNIASPLVIDLLIAGVDLLAFTVQKEVADRLRATASDEAYGPLSIVAQMLARVEVLRVLPPGAFWPVPKVESALVRMTRNDRLGDRAAAFSRFVHQVFGFRRKTLRKAFSQAGYDSRMLQVQGIDPQLRPENLTGEQFLRLFEATTAGTSAK